MDSMTINQAASRLGTSPTHIRRLVRTGDLEAVDVSRNGANRRTLRILPEAFEEFIQSRQHCAKEEEPERISPGMRSRLERAGLL